MRNLKLTLAYDGTSYFGWQIQPDRPTIQQALQHAFQQLTGERVTANCAGRTDAGVHALGQVANFRATTSLPNDRLLLGLQHHLADDISIREICDVPEDFHATISAKRKSYRYVIHESRLRDPFTRRFAWRITRKLDVSAMSVAARSLVGRQDFSCFETQGSPRADTVRTLFDAVVHRCRPWNVFSAEHVPQADTTGEFIVVEVTGDGFLYNMVRAIAGTLVEVGLGKRSPESIAALVASRCRAKAGQTAPPQGLFLVRVDYDT